MNRKSQIFFGAFAITLIFIIAAAGFVAVDLSTDRYMPDQFGPFFEITSIKSDHVNFKFLAGSYRLDISPNGILHAGLAKYRGLIPASPRVAAFLTAEAIQRAIEQIENGQSVS